MNPDNEEELHNQVILTKEETQHLWCGTPDCCQSCETATPVPIQLEFNFEKDTNE